MLGELQWAQVRVFSIKVPDLKRHSDVPAVDTARSRSVSAIPQHANHSRTVCDGRLLQELSRAAKEIVNWLLILARLEAMNGTHITG